MELEDSVDHIFARGGFIIRRLAAVANPAGAMVWEVIPRNVGIERLHDYIFQGATG